MTDENKTNQNVDEQADNSTSETNAERTYTENEVLKMIQSESDRRVTQALQKQKKEYEKKLSLSQLDGDARDKAEKDNRIAELEEQLKEFTLLQNKAEVVKVLSARNLSPEFVDIVEIGDDVEVAQQKIEQLDRLIKKAVADEVKRRLAGSTPKEGNKTDGITKKDFQKMTLAQQSQLYRENPELYKKLTQ